MTSPLRLFGIALVVLSCAASPKRPQASSPRLNDSAPEKVAAQRAGAPSSLRLEQDDERWSIDAARQRKREQDDKRAAKQPAAGSTAVDLTTPPAR